MTILHIQIRNLLKGLLFLLILMCAALSEAQAFEYRVEREVGFQGGGVYLVSEPSSKKNYLMRLDCVEGWDGSRAFYSKNVEIYPDSSVPESLDSKQRLKVFVLQSTKACFKLRDGCDFTPGQAISLNKLNKKAVSFEFECAPKPAPAKAAATPKSAS